MSRSLQTLFDEILHLRDSLGSPIRSLVRPPLPPAERTALLKKTGVQVPGILHELYAITDGFEIGAPFIGAKRLLPIRSAVAAFERWKPILSEYEDPPLFPIAEDEFGEAYGVLLGSSEDDPPVHSLPLQMDAAQFFDSVTLMFVTLAEWLRAGVKSAYDDDGDADEFHRRLAIARRLNPKSCYTKVD